MKPPCTIITHLWKPLSTTISCYWFDNFEPAGPVLECLECFCCLDGQSGRTEDSGWLWLDSCCRIIISGDGMSPWWILNWEYPSRSIWLSCIPYLDNNDSNHTQNDQKEERHDTFVSRNLQNVCVITFSWCLCTSLASVCQREGGSTWRPISFTNWLAFFSEKWTESSSLPILFICSVWKQDEI
jgi:hypothetical protein